MVCHTVTPSRLSTSDYLSVNAPQNANPAQYFVSFGFVGAQEGNYSIVVYTPGCIQDDTCSTRGMVNVSINVINEGGDSSPEYSTDLSQTNDYDKYDHIYMGAFNKSEGNWVPTVRIAPRRDSPDILIVAQKVAALFLPDDPDASTSAPTSTCAPDEFCNNALTTSRIGPSTAVSSPSDPAAASPSPLSSPPPDRSLSLAAKIGIGLGVPFAVVLLAGLTAIIGFLRRRKHQPARPLPAEVEGAPSGRREMATNANRHEMAGRIIVPPEYQEVEGDVTPRQSEAVELKA